MAGDTGSPGSGSGSYSADTFTSETYAPSPVPAIDTSAVDDPAPESGYQSLRYGPSFVYSIPDLTPGSSYVVRLHFAELVLSSPGQREFQVAINGNRVLTNFDIVATADRLYNTTNGEDKAVIESFIVNADGNGVITIDFTEGAVNLPQVNGIQVMPITPVVALSSGSSYPSSPYGADAYYSGGVSYFTDDLVKTSKVANPASYLVYQHVRAGTFTYTIPDLTPGETYDVRLQFAEWGVNGPNQRRFDVAINGQSVLSNFDINAEAGGRDIAISRSFNVVASSDGTISIAFTNGAAGEPIVSAVEVIPGGIIGIAAGFECRDRRLFRRYLRQQRGGPFSSSFDRARPGSQSRPSRRLPNRPGRLIVQLHDSEPDARHGIRRPPPLRRAGLRSTVPARVQRIDQRSGRAEQLRYLSSGGRRREHGDRRVVQRLRRRPRKHQHRVHARSGRRAGGQRD